MYNGNRWARSNYFDTNTPETDLQCTPYCRSPHKTPTRKQNDRGYTTKMRQINTIHEFLPSFLPTPSHFPIPQSPTPNPQTYTPPPPFLLPALIHFNVPSLPPSLPTSPTTILTKSLLTQ
jgi:hypothetical protein